MKKFANTTLLILLLNLTLPVWASDLSIIGTIPSRVEPQSPTAMSSVGSREKQNIIMLQKIKLSPSAQKAFANRIEKIKQPSELLFSAQTTKDGIALPTSINLGMNNVPVLDQGMHGSCVTFAVAGLIDSLVGKKDYVSELCSLTLGNYLAKNNSHYPSGWNGSSGQIVLRQFFNYGIVPMSKQKRVGCGGLTSYPAWDPYSEGGNTSPSKYAAISKPISNEYVWRDVLSSDFAFIDSRYNPNQMLLNVKKALNDGSRVTFGVLLDVAQGSNGAVGKHHVYFSYDTWMLTPAIIDDIKHNLVDAGHQMIITGYDDNAVIKDSWGHKNKGLLTLRNSWGFLAGDYGNYYMSYDHFMAMAHGIQVITPKKQ